MADLSAQRLGVFITAFGAQVAEPGPGLASTRCLSLRTVRGVFSRLRAHEELRWLRQHSAMSLVQHLVNASLLVPLSHTAPVEPADQLFAAGLAVDPATIEPLEILAALEPSGIISYFSAMALHELTTQVPPHHHTARTVTRKIDLRRAPSSARPEGDEVGSLGTVRYEIRGTRYYSTLRDRRLVPGVQSRWLSPTLQLRCTTLEQTLVDGLIRPISCGGEGVVLEAWDRSVEQRNESEVLRVATAIAHPVLGRRVGFMLEATGRVAPLDPATHAQLTQESPLDDLVSLLPGVRYQRRDTRWGLLVP